MAFAGLLISLTNFHRQIKVTEHNQQASFGVRVGNEAPSDDGWLIVDVWAGRSVVWFVNYSDIIIT